MGERRYFGDSMNHRKRVEERENNHLDNRERSSFPRVQVLLHSLPRVC